MRRKGIDAFLQKTKIFFLQKEKRLFDLQSFCSEWPVFIGES
jgi:hypothetical protein